MKSIKSYVKELEDLLGPVDKKLSKEINDHFDKIERQYEWMKENNIPEEIQKYYFDLETLKNVGYKPIAVTTMMCENTFVFETQDEADRAYLEFERHPKGEYISGWWHSKEDFLQNLEDYKKEFTLPLGYEPHIIWL